MQVYLKIIYDFILSETLRALVFLCFGVFLLLFSLGCFVLFFDHHLLLAGAMFYLSLLNLDRSLLSKEPSSSTLMIMLS